METKEIEPGLLVSSCGRIFREVKYFDHGNSKIKYLSFNFRGSRKSVHRAVAEAFIPNFENKPCACHKDDNPQNNRSENLFWGTHKENMEDMRKKGRLKSSRNESFQFRNEYIVSKHKAGIKNQDIADELGLTSGRISQIIQELVYFSKVETDFCRKGIIF